MKDVLVEIIIRLFLILVVLIIGAAAVGLTYLFSRFIIPIIVVLIGVYILVNPNKFT